MPQDTKEVQSAIDLYCTLMGEIKFRLEFVKDIIHGKNPIAGTIGKDICYLELRMVCELIALGSLVAHGDIKARSKKLTEKWQADLLIAQMAKVHANFYPQPATLPPGGVPTRTGEIRSMPRR
jgi:hypothetical protein